MAVNGRLLTVDDREDLWAAGWEQLPREKAAATLLIFNDRKATLDSLHQFLHAPRKAPVKDAIKCIVAKEIRIDLPHLIQTLSDCKDATSLILEKNEIRSDGMAQLVDALQFRNTLEVLSLKRNFIGDKGASALGEMMAKWKCRKLHTLCLSYCNIGGQGFEGLCMGLSRMPTVLSLTSLDLSANFCKVDGCKALAPLIMDHRKLNYLNLSNNCLEDDGVKVLAASIAHSDVLETLYLEGNHITNAGVRSLCDGLKNNCGLTALGLSCNEIDHHGAMYISQALRGNTRLTSLDLSHNAVGDVGSEFMAGMIRSVSTLKELHLVDNAVGDVGGKYIQLAYEKNTTLMLLDLDMNKMQDKQHEALASAMRTRGHIGILRVGCHAYGNLRPENKFLELAKAQIEQEEAEKENELKPQTPSLSSRGTSRGTSSKPGLDTGNVKLVVKKKEEAPQPTGPIGVLFKKWSGAGAGQKGSKKAKSVDFKEFTEMLKAFKLMPGKMGRHKAQEIFRQANRRADDPTPDGDTDEMDWDEFEFALNKVCEFCKVTPEQLVEMDGALGLLSPESGKEPRKATGPLRGKEKIENKGAALGPDASLNEIFITFAAGDGQSKKRAASMDGKEFTALLQFLKLMPAKVNKTQAMDIYAKGKAKSGGDKSEMDWDGFEFAMKKVAELLGVSYGLLHTFRQSADADAPSPAGGKPAAVSKLQKAGTKVSAALKLGQAKTSPREKSSPREKTAGSETVSPRKPDTSPRKVQDSIISSRSSLSSTGKKVSNALKVRSPRK